jgi:DNA-binding CsgD family transcriptional regulator
MDIRMSAPVHQAHTLALHVSHLRHCGSTAPGVEELAARAREIAEALGLARVLRMLAPSDSGRSTRWDGLTARELEVLGLLGEGLSNRGIAGRLMISENTAANHVRSILAKTGSENRTQAAMYGRDQRT